MDRKNSKIKIYEFKNLTHSFGKELKKNWNIIIRKLYASEFFTKSSWTFLRNFSSIYS